MAHARDRPILLRQAKPGDLSFISAAEKESAGFPGRPGRDDDPDAETIAMLAERDGVPVGFARLTLRIDRLVIERLFVEPGARRQGVGRALLTRAEATALALARPEILAVCGGLGEAETGLFSSAAFHAVPGWRVRGGWRKEL